MSYGKAKVRIKGLTPLLMNRMNPEDLKSKTRKGTEEDTATKLFEEALRTAYIDKINGKRQLYIPSEAIFRCMINASGIYRSKKMSLRNFIAGSVRIEPEKIPLGTDKFEVDTRVVRIQKAAVLKARAKVPNWEAEFDLIYDKTIISREIVETIEQILNDGGRRFGLLDYRPAKGGQFGVFEVTEFKISE